MTGADLKAIANRLRAALGEGWVVALDPDRWYLQVTRDGLAVLQIDRSRTVYALRGFAGRGRPLQVLLPTRRNWRQRLVEHSVALLGVEGRRYSVCSSCCTARGPRLALAGWRCADCSGADQ